MVRQAFKNLARTFENVETTASIISTVQTLAGFLKRLSPEEARATAYLLQGRVAPPFQPTEFGMAERMVARALALAYRGSDKEIERALARSGDLGLVAEERASGQGERLSIDDVFDRLKAIAETADVGSQRKKIENLAQLLRAVSGIEAKYIARTIVGSLRIGVAVMT